MRDYELTIIISPEVEEERLASVVEKVTNWITNRGGTIEKIEPWGKRRLAYTIKDFREGVYVLIRVKMDPSLGDELESSLRISEDVLRHLLVRTES